MGQPPPPPPADPNIEFGRTKFLSLANRPACSEFSLYSGGGGGGRRETPDLPKFGLQLLICLSCSAQRPERRQIRRDAQGEATMPQLNLTKCMWQGLRVIPLNQTLARVRTEGGGGGGGCTGQVSPFGKWGRLRVLGFPRPRSQLKIRGPQTGKLFHWPASGVFRWLWVRVGWFWGSVSLQGADSGQFMR